MLTCVMSIMCLWMFHFASCHEDAKNRELQRTYCIPVSCRTTSLGSVGQSRQLAATSPCSPQELSVGSSNKGDRSKISFDLRKRPCLSFSHSVLLCPCISFHFISWFLLPCHSWTFFFFRLHSLTVWFTGGLCPKQSDAGGPNCRTSHRSRHWSHLWRSHVMPNSFAPTCRICPDLDLTWRAPEMRSFCRKIILPKRPPSDSSLGYCQLVEVWNLEHAVWHVCTCMHMHWHQAEVIWRLICVIFVYSSVALISKGALEVHSSIASCEKEGPTKSENSTCFRQWLPRWREWFWCEVRSKTLDVIWSHIWNHCRQAEASWLIDESTQST